MICDKCKEQYGCLRSRYEVVLECKHYSPFTNFDRIKAMSVEKMAEYFALDKHPSTPCYICGYDDGLFCTKEDCNSEYKIKVFKEFLESEVQEDE